MPRSGRMQHRQRAQSPMHMAAPPRQREMPPTQAPTRLHTPAHTPPTPRPTSETAVAPASAAPPTARVAMLSRVREKEGCGSAQKCGEVQQRKLRRQRAETRRERRGTTPRKKNTSVFFMLLCALSGLGLQWTWTQSL